MAHIDKLGASCSPVDQATKKRLSMCPQNPSVVQFFFFSGQGPCLSYSSQYLSWYLLLKKSGRHFLALGHDSLEVKNMSSKI